MELDSIQGHMIFSDNFFELIFPCRIEMRNLMLNYIDMTANVND